MKNNKITMDGNKIIVAVFTKLKYNLSVSVSPENAGTVTATLVMPEKSAYDVETGQVVHLAAEPKSGYVFDHWVFGTDTSNTSSSMEITMDEDKTVVAHFVPAIQGYVYRARTLAPMANVTISFSDGGTVITDEDGYWIKKYDPLTPPSGPVTVIPIANDLCWETHSPDSATVNWPGGGSFLRLKVTGLPRNGVLCRIRSI